MHRFGVFLSKITVLGALGGLGLSVMAQGLTIESGTPGAVKPAAAPFVAVGQEIVTTARPVKLTRSQAWPLEGAQAAQAVQATGVKEAKSPTAANKNSSAPSSAPSAPITKLNQSIDQHKLISSSMPVAIGSGPAPAASGAKGGETGAGRGKFEIKLSDETLYLALRRWSSESGFQLVWDAGKDFPARYTSYKAASFEDAIEQVMHDSEGSGYPLHACLYKNHLVRVLHVSEPCMKK